MKRIIYVLGILVAGLPMEGSAREGDPALVNGNFEMDGGAFQVPIGWTPFGEGGYEGYWEDGDWKAQTGDPPPLQSAGLYQVVPNVTPGARYRLTAEANGGGAQTPVRIGFVPFPSAGLDEAIWSEDHEPHEWKTISVEATARGPALVVILEFRNTNPEHFLIRRGAWDNVRIEKIGDGKRPQLPVPAEHVIPAPSDTFENLANLWSLAYPKPGVRAYLASTHDPNPEGNTDYGRFEGSFVEDGETWTVLKSFDGPGVITRIWLTEFAKLRETDIRIDIDGERVVDQLLRDFFGTPGLFHFPLTNRTSGAWVSYVPMPFAESARVSIKGAIEGSFYWQINYQLFDFGEGLRPFTDPLKPADAKHLRTIYDQWGAATMNPKPAWPGTKEASGSVDLEPGGTVTLWSVEDAGMVDAFWIDVPAENGSLSRNLRIQAAWDGSGNRQVDAPFDLFFGAGAGVRIVRGLLAGVAPPNGAYSYFPMPYRDGAALMVSSATNASALINIRYRVGWVPLSEGEVSPLRFHATSVEDPRAGEGRLLVPLETEGRGHFVGLSADMASGEVEDVHFLEGDEYFWVDGEKQPSWAGTGTEDYFTCGWYFFGGKISLPVIGAPYVGRDDHRIVAYRFHPSDWVPFERSLKFGLEVGDRMSSEEYGNYRTVAYYYLAPGSD